MEKSLGKAATWGIVLLCALILANGVLSYRNLLLLHEDMEKTERSREAILRVESVFSLAKDLETGARGYGLTGKTDFLKPYNHARQDLDNELALVKSLLKDATDRQPVLERLTQLIARKQVLAGELIVARDERGVEGAAAHVATGIGRRTMDDLREVVQQIRELEFQSLTHWTHEADASYRTAVISLFNATAGGLVLVGAIYLLIRREGAERTRNEQRLRASEARFRRLADANVIGVLFADYQGRVHQANDSFLQMIGYSREELASGSIDWIKMTPAEHAESDRRAIEELRRTGVCEPFEKEYIRKDGSRVPCLIGCAQLEDTQDMAICYAIDLTERNRAAAEISRLNTDLQNRLHELETLLELMPIGVAIAKDPECREISANSACSRLLGLAHGVNASLSASDSQRPRSFRVFRDSKEIAVNDLPMQRAVSTGQPVLGVECEIVRSDGESLNLLEYVAPLLNEDGRVRGAVGVFVDITESKKLEAQLRAHAAFAEDQQHWLQSLLDLLPVPLLLIQPETAKVTFANRAAHDMAGGSFPIGDSAERYDQLYYSTDTDGFRIPHEQMPAMRVARGERLERLEMNWHIPQGARTLMINADSLPAMYGHQPVAVLLFQDITSLKQVEAELRRTNAAKDALLAMLGHELRNPLAAVTGSADVIATHPVDHPAYRSALDILQRHIKHLTRLVDDMLDLTRLTTGKIRLRLENIDLLEPLNHAIQATQTMFESRRHELRTELPTKSVYLHADRARLEQVFTNLLMNAAKYTDPGGRIELRAWVDSDDVVISVRDNGIGIDPGVIPRLFDLFSQVNPALDRSQTGLGIGLTVVRNLVELHGGDVQAISSGIGQGSEFVVRLPLGKASATETPAVADQPTATTRRLKVLIVEDNVDLAHVTLALIERCGHEPTWFATADEALAAIEQLSPHVGLLDIGLPGMNGYELAIELRKIPRLSRIPLVALTGFGQQDDRRRSEDAGFNMHLVKPVSLEALETMFRDCAAAMMESSETCS